MAETNEPVPPEGPETANLTLEARLRTLGLGGQDGDTDPDTELDTRLAACAAGLASVSSALDAHRVQTRDLEKSLVERIADVDDDRRLTAAQLQRAWQSQREDLDARLQRHGRLVAGALVLIAALGAVGLFALHRQIQSSQGVPDPRVSQLRRDLDRLAAVRTQDTAVDEKLAALSEAVGRVSRDLAAPNPRPQPVGNQAADPRLAALTGRIERIGTEQARVDRELGRLRAALDDRPDPSPSAAAVAPVAAVAAAAAPAGPGGGESVAAPATDASRAPAPSSPVGETAGPEPRTVAVADRPFALQLLGSYSREDLLAWAARPGLPARVYVVKENRRGRPWFVLIHSLHGTRAQAQTTLARLPPALLAPKPWIRNFPPDTGVEPVATGAGN